MRRFRDATFIISIFFSLSQTNVILFDLYYFYLLIIILFPVLILKHKTIEKNILICFIYLFIIGLTNVTLNNNEIFQLLKVVLSSFFFYWLYYLILKDENYNLQYFFRLYYKSCVIAAYVGVIQFVSFLVNFEPGYNFGWLGLRQIGLAEMAGATLYPIHSFFGEPAAYGLVLSPAIYMVLDYIKNGSSFLKIKKTEVYLIIITYLLTQSSTGYIAFLFCLLLININQINSKRILLILSGIPFTIFLLNSISPKFQDRLESSIKLVTGQIILDGIDNENTNGSSLILFNHFLIAKDNAKDHPFGTGLGSHHAAFYKYNTLQTYFTGYGPNSVILNINDASSLFNRILSEIGIIGIIFTIVFIFSNFLKIDITDYTLINHSSLAMLFTALLRGGHYFLYGLPFFILCYYYSFKFSQRSLDK